MLWVDIGMPCFRLTKYLYRKSPNIATCTNCIIRKKYPAHADGYSTRVIEKDRRTWKDELL
jgi:hypothetical protein